MSESKSQLAVALAKAQGEFPAIKKTRTAKAGTFSYTYADLSDILHAVMEVLGKNGIALTQRYAVQEGTILLETMLLHASGEVLSSVLPIQNPNLSPQQLGSLLTYLRRYSISALLGIAAEDDDDASSSEAAEPAPVRKATPVPPRAKPAPTEPTGISAMDAASLLAACRKRSEALGAEGIEVHGFRICSHVLKELDLPALGKVNQTGAIEFLRSVMSEKWMTAFRKGIETYTPKDEEPDGFVGEE